MFYLRTVTIATVTATAIMTIRQTTHNMMTIPKVAESA